MLAPQKRSSFQGLRLVLLGVGAVAALVVVIARLPRTEKSDPGAGPEGTPHAEGAARPEPGPVPPAPPESPGAAPRDPALDRDLTGSAEAFKLYAEGVELWRGLPAQAAARFRRAVLLDPEFAPAHYRLAMSALMMARRDEAAAEAKTALQLRERLPEPYRTAAPVLDRFVAGSFDLVIAELPDALARQPSDPDLNYLAAATYAASCDHFDPDAAVERFERVLAADPGYPCARPALMTAYAMKGMNDWSLTRALENLSLHPQSSEATAEVGRVRIARGEYGDAIDAADELLRRGEDVFARGLAPAFILAGYNEQVAGMYDSEIERRNDAAANALTHLHAGINDVRLGRFDKAVEHFERGPEFLPGQWQRSGRALFFLLLGRTHALIGRSREADAALEAAQQVAGPRPVLEYSLGLAKLRSGSVAEAERALRRLAQEVRVSQPGWNEPWRRLLSGEIALAAGETTRAIDELREAWRLQKPLATDCIVEYTDAYFLDALGRAWLAAGRAQEALQAFDQVRGLGVRGLLQPEIVALSPFRCARALEMLGRDDEARARYRQFLALWAKADGPPAEVTEALKRLESTGKEVP